MRMRVRIVRVCAQRSCSHFCTYPARLDLKDPFRRRDRDVAGFELNTHSDGRSPKFATTSNMRTLRAKHPRLPHTCPSPFPLPHRDSIP